MQPQTEQAEVVERRPITQAELQMLADAWRREFPELWHKQPGDVLTRWRRIADRHQILVEHRRPKKAQV